MMKLEDYRICDCGNCKEAIETAIKVFKQANEYNCLHWYAALAGVHIMIAQRLIGSDAELAVRGIEVAQVLSSKQGSEYIDELLVKALTND